MRVTAGQQAHVASNGLLQRYPSHRAAGAARGAAFAAGSALERSRPGRIDVPTVSTATAELTTVPSGPAVSAGEGHPIGGVVHHHRASVATIAAERSRVASATSGSPGQATWLLEASHVERTSTPALASCSSGVPALAPVSGEQARARFHDAANYESARVPSLAAGGQSIASIPPVAAGQKIGRAHVASNTPVAAQASRAAESDRAAAAVSTIPREAVETARNSGSDVHAPSVTSLTTLSGQEAQIEAACATIAGVTAGTRNRTQVGGPRTAQDQTGISAISAITGLILGGVSSCAAISTVHQEGAVAEQIRADQSDRPPVAPGSAGLAGRPGGAVASAAADYAGHSHVCVRADQGDVSAGRPGGAIEAQHATDLNPLARGHHKVLGTGKRDSDSVVYLKAREQQAVLGGIPSRGDGAPAGSRGQHTGVGIERIGSTRQTKRCGLGAR